MSNTITLELPAFLFISTDAPPHVAIPSRLERIAARNQAHLVAGALFAVAATTFAALCALGIAGF